MGARRVELERVELLVEGVRRVPGLVYGWVLAGKLQLESATWAQVVGVVDREVGAFLFT